jgi:hypothetical protein
LFKLNVSDSRLCAAGNVTDERTWVWSGTEALNLQHPTTV